jgi:hypothetical protein
MAGDSRSESEGCLALDGDLDKSGKHRCKIVAHADFQQRTAFHQRENRRDLLFCSAPTAHPKR